MIGIGLILGCGIQNAATVDASEYAALQREVAQSKWVPVLVHLRTSTLSELANSPSTVRAESEALFTKLSAELGRHALRNGRWRNFAGQVEMYVDADGLASLRKSDNAIAFMRGKGWESRSALLSLGGSHVAMERLLVADGAVDLEVILNVDGLEIGYLADGTLRFVAETLAVEAAATRWNAFLLQLKSDEVSRSPKRMESDSSVRRYVSLTREGVLRLIETDLVRSVTPIEHTDQRPRWIDPSIESAGPNPSELEVLITLRSEMFGGRMSPASSDALARSNRAALIDIVRASGHSGKAADFSRLGSFGVRLSSAQLRALIDSPDRRILSIQNNNPIAVPHLSVASASMNVPWAWNAGYKGLGQSIAIIDTGVEASHPFLTGRVTYQACFGTLSSTYQSDCPGAYPWTDWDSPLGTAGAGLAIFGDDHGTHVAGIAAGNSGGGSLQGMAPDATIYSINVFSRRIGGSALLAHPVDILGALNLGVSQLPPLAAPNKQPVTFNLSLGGGGNSTPQFCALNDFVNASNSSFVVAVHALRSAGIPVVASTGNDNTTTGIAWPACLPGIVKVSATLNDGIGSTRAPGSNVVNPASYPGETFWFAPGGSVASGGFVSSSVLGGQYGGKGGTSMASPMIAGLYAVAKGVVPGWGDSDITAYFLANFALNVPIVVGSPPTPVNWKRIRFP